MYWITGLSGAGKTTVAQGLLSRLQSAGRRVIFLDGDALRTVVADDLGFTLDDRARSAMRNARLSRLLAQQGYDVICATISMFHNTQRWNRKNIENYFEIYLRVPLSELHRRDAKEIYARASRGEIANVVGVDIAAEEPEAPDIVIENFGDTSPKTAVDAILKGLSITNRGFDRPRFVDHGGVQFGSKAETLDRLYGKLKSARVLPQVRFTVSEWRQKPDDVLNRLSTVLWQSDEFIVRSSALAEDAFATSNAGRYKTIPDVEGIAALRAAIDEVIESYGAEATADDQVFVQPMVTDIAMAGVAFSKDPNTGGHYLVFNFDETSHRADTVTSGSDAGLRTYYWHRHGHKPLPETLGSVFRLLEELETLLGHDALDIEFAVSSSGEVTLHQVRPLQMPVGQRIDLETHSTAVSEIARKVGLLNRPHPYLFGKRSVFGVMPDWNPAEIIGLKPRPLSLSLYRELVTDEI